jgi:surfeit locus 1 family protein
MTPSATQRAPIAGAAIATAVALAILIALGVWQLHRLAWKEGLLAQIDAAEHAPPTPLAATTTTATPALFTRVTATGTLRGEPHALYGSEVQNDHLGAQLVEILDRDHAPPIVVVLGWVATDRGKLHPVSGPATITGYIRLPESPNWLSAADDLQGRHFYTLAPATLGTALGAPDAAPFTLVALGPPPASPNAPVPADALPRPVNNHLQYALTWFGLGAALLGVFVAWVIKRP